MCVGVWGGINWFVREVEALRKVEEQAEGIRRVQGILEEEEKERQQDESDDAGRSTGVEISAEEQVERRKADDEEEDDGFEKVEKEDGYETEGRKSK